MREYGPSYEEQLQPIVRSVEPKVEFYSSVTGRRLTGAGKLEASYWRANMESPVLFNSALRSALDKKTQDDSKVILVEIGPHPALAGPIGQILRDLGRTDVVHVGTLARGKGGHDSLLHAAGKMYQHAAPVNLSVLCPPGKIVPDLPRYAWNRDTSHWAESRVAREWRLRAHPPHELLGNRVVETGGGQPVWRKVLHLEDALWLTGHEVNGRVVFPAAGYIAMVGEALRQLSVGSNDDANQRASAYSLKNVKIAAARVIEMDKSVELVTSLKLTPGSDTSEGALRYYDFSISSSEGDGTDWIVNCEGEAAFSEDQSLCCDGSVDGPLSNSPFPRSVEEKAWYQLLRRVGYNYTGLFEGMTGITAGTTAREARAAATMPSQANTKYTLHPALLDQCFQLFTVAASRGLSRNMGALAVPTFVDEMVISSPRNADPTSTLDVTAKIPALDEAGSWTGDLVAMSAASMPVVRLKGMKTSVLARDSSAENGAPVISQLEWKPHCDYNGGLGAGLHPRSPWLKEWPLLEELIILCSFDHIEQIQIERRNTNEKPPEEHLVKFWIWMRSHTQRYQFGLNPLVSTDLQLQNLSREQRVARIKAIVDRLTSPTSSTATNSTSASHSAAYALAIHSLFDAAASIFAGEAHALHVLMRDNVLSRFYDAMAFDSTDAIRRLANTNPRLRVLEIGAGTGGTTARVLEALTSPWGERMFELYSYTDISAGFMAAAKERFAAAGDAIEYGVLDISKDPVEQGFRAGSYDLIIAANVSSLS